MYLKSWTTTSVHLVNACSCRLQLLYDRLALTLLLSVIIEAIVWYLWPNEGWFLEVLEIENEVLHLPTLTPSAILYFVIVSGDIVLPANVIGIVKY